MTSHQQQQQDHHKWALGLSGGGLRSCSASAVFCLASMHTPLLLHGHDQGSSSSSNEATQNTLWDKFSRVIGISGGSWFVSAFQAGAFRNLNETYTIDELLDVLQLSSVYSGDSLKRQEKIAHYLGKQSGVNIYHLDGLLSGQEDIPPPQPPATTQNQNDDNHNNVTTSSSSSSFSSSYERFLKHRDHFANSARNAIRSGFVNSVLRPVASILDNKFGEGVVIAVSSETPLEEYRRYLKQRLLLVSSSSTTSTLAGEDSAEIQERTNSSSFNFGSIPSREELFLLDENNDEDEKKKKSNTIAQSKNRDKELWMACIGSEDAALSRRENFNVGSVVNNNQQQPQHFEMPSNNNQQQGSSSASQQSFSQPEWNPVSVKSASSTSWIAFSISGGDNSSSVYQISLFEEETKAALPYNTNTNISNDQSGTGKKNNNNSGSSSYQYKIKKRELVPLEEMPLERMCAFCGSAFSASASNIMDHAVSNGLGRVLTSISGTLFGRERQDQVHASPVLGTKTVDSVRFFRKELEDQNQQQHQKNVVAEELTIGLRDAGLEVNIPFLFLERELFNVAFALDSGSDAEVGRQIMWAQKRGHLGDYIPVFSPGEANKISRLESEETATKNYFDNTNKNQKDATVTSASSSSTNNDDDKSKDKNKKKEKQMWQIYMKDKSSDLGPSVIVYLIGLDDAELMEVQDVDARLKKLKNRYEEMKQELKVITKWLVERGF